MLPTISQFYGVHGYGCLLFRTSDTLAMLLGGANII